MQTLRNAHLIARFVLVWFALFIGTGIASSLVKPQAMELICSSSGVMKVLVKTDEGSKEVVSYSLDCPLCASTSAPPPPPVGLSFDPAQPLAYVLRSIPATHIAALTAAPFPARGPPAFS